MICPVCGHENSDLATVCSSCGAKLQPDWDGTWTSGLEVPGEEDTATREKASDAPPPDPSEPRLADVARAFSRLCSTKARRSRDAIRRHPRMAAGILLGILAAVAAAVVLVTTLAHAPSDAMLAADLAQRAPDITYSAGPYADDATIDITEASITRKRGTDLPAGATSDASLGPQAWRIEAELRYTGTAIEIIKSVAATYVYSEGGWELAGTLEDQGTSTRALAGVDQDKVLASMSVVLEQADGETTGESVSSAYQDASFTVTSESFEQSPENDTSTDTLTIHGTHEGTFSSLEADVTAVFAFKNGTWSLRSASVDENALTPHYDVLEGTWTGSFSTTSSTKASCYGASTYPLAIQIEDVGDSSSAKDMVTGTISGLAHYHDAPASDEDADPGDVELSKVAFTGTISTEHSDDTESDLNIDCSIPDATGGSVEFILGFGVDGQDNAARAVVRTTHEYTETVLFVLPHDTSVTYTDTYRLSRDDASD